MHDYIWLVSGFWFILSHYLYQMSNNHSYISSALLVMQLRPMRTSAAGSAAQMHESLQELVWSVMHLKLMWHTAYEILWISTDTQSVHI